MRKITWQHLLLVYVIIFLTSVAVRNYMGRECLIAFLFLALVIIALAYGTPTILRRRPFFLRSLRIPQTPETVWQVITDYATWPTWPLDEDRERDEQSKMPWNMEVIETARPHRLVTRFVTDKPGFAIRWEFRVAKVKGGSRLRLRQYNEASLIWLILMWDPDSRGIVAKQFLGFVASKLASLRGHEDRKKAGL